MKDYYKDFIGKNSENIAGNKVSEVSKPTSDTAVSDENLNGFSLSELLAGQVELLKQFEFEVEERTAVMIFDGGLSESEAIRTARADVEKIWIGLFIPEPPSNEWQ